jgi:mRNA interferase HicA
MKRLELVRYLQKHGCELLREGGKHTVFVNRAARKITTHERKNYES